MAIPGGGTFLNPLFQVISFGAGTAMGPVLRPTLQDLANEVWALHTVRPLSAAEAARALVEGAWTRDRAVSEAAKTGYSGELLDVLRDLADEPPDLAMLMELWRRNLISGDDFIRGLRHAGIEAEWFEAIRQTHNRLLSPPDLASLRQRGFITRAEQYAEADLQGITNERAEHQFELSGLPPGPERALAMWRRGILSEAEFRQAIVEGNEKLKYVDAEAALRHPLLSPAQIVNQRLRGWRDTAWMVARGAEHGYSAEQMTDLFQGQGRPITFRQVFIGERRGGVYDGPTGELDDAFLKSLQESNIRPEWYNLAWAQRHSLPSAFVMRALTQAGDITQADAERLLLWSGWPEELAQKVAAAWSGGGAAGEGPLVRSARTQAVTEIRSAYLIGQADDGQARGWLSALDVTAADQDGLLAIWGVMREVPQKGLTAAQIKKAYVKLPGQWPRARALDELVLLGYTRDDAATYLDE